MKTLIKNGTVITAEMTRKADILVEGEIIRRIDANIEDPEAKIVDASGLLVLPGGVDPHVHLELPMFGTISTDDHYTGGKAAAFGGTTTMIDLFPRSLSAWRKTSPGIAPWRIRKPASTTVFI